MCFSEVSPVMDTFKPLLRPEQTFAVNVEVRGYDHSLCNWVSERNYVYMERVETFDSIHESLDEIATMSTQPFSGLSARVPTALP